MDTYLLKKRKADDEPEENVQKSKRSCTQSSEDGNDSTSSTEDTGMNDCATSSFVVKPPVCKEIRAEKLDVDYCVLFSKSCADDLFKECEKLLTYNEGQLAKVHICGKWHDIPRKQVAHGDTGLSYSFSKTTVPARPWTPFLLKIRETISEVSGYKFNFVLINRYKDGSDYIGEHRDDERDLEDGFPIASLSLGQQRDFIFKHADARGKNAKRKIGTVKIELQHGSLLMMKHPTNTYWYHSLPQRKLLKNVRINMTFRKMVTT